MQPTTAPPAVTPSALRQFTGFVQPAVWDIRLTNVPFPGFHASLWPPIVTRVLPVLVRFYSGDGG